MTRRLSVVSMAMAMAMPRAEVVRWDSWVADGGLMGYLASCGKRSLEAVRRGLTYGTVTASVAVQDFSVAPFREVSREQLNDRHDAFLKAIRF